MDTESTKTLLWKFPVSGNGKVNNTDKQGFEFSVRKAVIKTAFQIQAVWHTTSKLENLIETYRVKSGIQLVKKKGGGRRREGEGKEQEEQEKEKKVGEKS